MKKTIISIIAIVLFSIRCVDPGFADNETVSFSYSYSNEEHEIPWGSPLTELPEKLDVSVYEDYLPLWSEPSTYTTGDAGFEVSIDAFSLYINNQSVSDLELYYAYNYSEEGYSSEKQDSSLYMVKYEPMWSLDEREFEKLLSDYTEKYGEPIMTETTSEGILFTSGGQQTSITYHRDYLWTGAESTGLRIRCDYEPWRGDYDNVEFFLGKTNLDATLLAGKLCEGASPIHASTVAASIVLLDENGSYICEIPYNTDLLVTTYDPDLNMFGVNFTLVESSTSISGGSISVSSSSVEYSGYISGTGLSIEYSDLLAHFENK